MGLFLTFACIGGNRPCKTRISIKIHPQIAKNVEK